MGPVRLSLIAARARNGVIGADGGLPWRLRDDLAFFKKVTNGCPVIMGRRTWESLPVRPLPGRSNLVMSRDWTYAAESARVYSSFVPALNAAKAMARKSGAGDVFVIGGASLYEAALPLADRLYITEVDAAPEGDTVFPAFDLSEWRCRELKTQPADARNDHAFRIIQCDRIN